MTTSFPVYGVPHELLGQAFATSANCGDTIWPQARALGAKKYHVSEAAITPIGVKLKNQVILGLGVSSNMPIPQVRRGIWGNTCKLSDQ